MGIGFSHCEASWAWSGFSEFRTRLAAEAGITLGAMLGFRGKCSECGRYLNDGLSWEKVIDPIKPLLWAKDLGGSISPEEAPGVSARLRQLVSDWDDAVDYDKKTALELADGLERAAAAGEPLTWGG